MSYRKWVDHCFQVFSTPNPPFIEFLDEDLLHDLRRTVWKRIWQADGLRTPSSIIYRDGMYDAWVAVARVLAAFHSLATFQTATPSHLLLEHTFAFVDAGLFVWRITDTRLVRAPRVTVTS